MAVLQQWGDPQYGKFRAVYFVPAILGHFTEAVTSFHFASPSRPFHILQRPSGTLLARSRVVNTERQNDIVSRHCVNLKIKTFIGTSRNAAMSQVWVAMIYYLLLAYTKFLSRCKHSITEITRRIKETLMHRLDLLELLTLTTTKPPGEFSIDDYQLTLALS